MKFLYVIRLRSLHALLSVLLILSSLLLLSSHEYQGGAREAITNQRFASMGRNLDLVVKGRLTNVEAKYISAAEFLGVSSEIDIIVTELTIEVAEILAGEYGGKTLIAFLNEGRIGQECRQEHDSPPPEPQIGDTIIIGLLHNSRGNNRYINQWTYAFFKVEDESLVPYKKKYYVASDDPIGILKESAEKRKFPYLYRNAEHVCTGTVIRNEIDDHMLFLQVDEVLKGTIGTQLIGIDYSNDVDLRRKSAGMRILAFLVTAEKGYRLYSGINSVFGIQNDQLIRRSSPLVTTLSEAKKTFVRITKEME